MNIVLIGFRGAGKTALAKILSEKLNMQLFSIDKMIEEKEGKRIREIVAEKGWQYFRELETQIIEQLADVENSIIDTGGGVVENPTNIDNLKKNGYIIYVQASLKDIKQRILNDPDRPKLNPTLDVEDDLTVTYNRRIPLYEEYSDFKVNSSTTSLEKCADQIIEYLGL
ncbi:MAG: shikimate kinase [Ignavibacteria bacterium]|nr:shikimate kinase [Ignavibacteria bacterium]